MGGRKAKGASPWPELEFNVDPNIRAHADSFLKNASEVEAVAKEKQTSPPHDLFLRLIHSACMLAKSVKKEPSVTKELQEVRALLNTQGEGVQSILKTLNSLENQSSRVVATVCAPRPQGAASAKTLPRTLWSHVTSPSSSPINGPLSSNENPSTSSAPAAVLLSPKDLEIHLRGTHATIVDPLRGQEARLIQRANQAIKDTTDPTIQQRKFSSGRVLPSGDILLQADSVEDVDHLIRKSQWCKSFGDSTFIKKRTWGVIMYGVDCNKINPDRKAETKAQLSADNAGRLSNTPANIEYVGWLLGSKAKDLQSSMLVVEFDDERAANTAIGRGLVLKGKNHTCSRYDKTFSIQQCFNCLTYGHIAKYCRRKHRCGYCAGDHLTENCKHPKDRTRAKCAVCLEKKFHEEQAKHYAFDRECPERAARLEEARSSRLNGPQFYPPVARTGDITTPGVADPNKDPTPAETSATRTRPRSRANTKTTSAKATRTTRSKSRPAACSKSNARAENNSQNERPRTASISAKATTAAPTTAPETEARPEGDPVSIPETPKANTQAPPNAPRAPRTSKALQAGTALSRTMSLSDIMAATKPSKKRRNAAKPMVENPDLDGEEALSHQTADNADANAHANTDADSHAEDTEDAGDQ
jgi:hypothetical protein